MNIRLQANLDIFRDLGALHHKSRYNLTLNNYNILLYKMNFP